MSTKLQTAPALKLASVALIVVGAIAAVSWLGSDSSEEIGKTTESTGSTTQQPDKKAIKAEEAAKSQQADDIRQLYARFQEVQNQNQASSELLKKIQEQLDAAKGVGLDPAQLATMVQKEIDKHLAGAASTSMEVGVDTDSALNGVPAQTPVAQPDASGNGAGVSLKGYDQYVVNNDPSAAPAEEKIEWVLPQDGPAEGTAVGEFLDKTVGANTLDFSTGGEPKKNGAGQSQDSKKQLIEYATIDKDAILYNAMVLNDLIGVVATGDTVQNPFQFKLELSAENLATSGIYLPDVAMMRMSGIVRGEWVTGCVEAKITGATFVFNDGHISQISVGNVGKDVGGGGSYLGYLTTIHGSPCIKGKKYSNLAEFASITGGLSALAAAGDAVASAQYSVTKDATNVLQTFDGNLASNAAGQGIAEGMNSVNQVIAARYANVRDLVVAPSGQYVVMLSKQLNIDYDPKGRRLLNENFENDLEKYHAQQAAADSVPQP